MIYTTIKVKLAPFHQTYGMKQAHEKDWFNGVIFHLFFESFVPLLYLDGVRFSTKFGDSLSGTENAFLIYSLSFASLQLTNFCATAVKYLCKKPATMYIPAVTKTILKVKHRKILQPPIQESVSPTFVSIYGSIQRPGLNT